MKVLDYIEKTISNNDKTKEANKSLKYEITSKTGVVYEINFVRHEDFKHFVNTQIDLGLGWSFKLIS